MADKKESYCAVHDTHPLGSDPCLSCIEDYKDRYRLRNKYDKATLVEASYLIASETFKKVPRSKTSVGYIRGYQKAGTVAHDVIKSMIDEAK